MTHPTRHLPTLALTTMIAMSGCTADAADDTTRSFVVSPVMRPCTSLYKDLCLEVAIDGAAPLINYTPIDGFAYEWGVTAELTVIETPIDPVPADGSAVHYQLGSIDHRTVDAPATTYLLPFYTGLGEPWFTAEGDHVRVGHVEIACAPAVCADLLAAPVDAAYGVRVKVTGDPAVPLRALALE